MEDTQSIEEINMKKDDINFNCCLISLEKHVIKIILKTFDPIISTHNDFK